MADTAGLDSAASAWRFESSCEHHGHGMVAYHLLISFDHYYSQLARKSAVVLCKLGLYAAMVLVVSTSAFQAERAGSSPIGCSICGVSSKEEH